MPVDVVWSEQAREQLLEIYVKVGLENPGAADRIYDRIDDLEHFPAAKNRNGIAESVLV